MQIGPCLRFVQPALVVWNDGSSPYNPDARFTLLNQHLTAGEMFAKRDLPIGPNDLDGEIVCRRSHFSCPRKLVQHYLRAIIRIRQALVSAIIPVVDDALVQ